MDPTPWLDGFVDAPQELWRSPVTHLIEEDLREFCNKTSKPSDHLFHFAVAEVTQQFLLPTPVKMLHLKEVFEQDLDIWNRSLELSWTQKGYATNDTIRQDPGAINRIRLFWHKIKVDEDLALPDSCVFVKSSQGEKKARAVLSYPATVLFAEAVFAVPLIDGYKKLPIERRPIAYGCETFYDFVLRIRRRFSGPKWYGSTLNFRKFDKLIPRWLIDIAFDICSLNIDFVYYRGYGVANARGMIRMFEKIREYFINTPIRIANGNRFRKTSGIASGSYFTQIIRSICYSILINYICLKTDVNLIDAVYLGDDSCIITTSPLDLDKVVSILKDLGVE